MKLSDKAIAGLVCPEAQKDQLVFDDETRGLGIRVTSKGAKVFIFQYGTAKLKRRVVLGPFGKELNLAQARKKADVLRGQVRDGRDPLAERKAAQAERAKAEADAKAAATQEAYTVEALIADWTEHHLSHRAASYAASAPAQMRRELKRWLKQPAASFTRSNAVQALDNTKERAGPVAANRLRAVSRACWGWAMKRGTLDGNVWDTTPMPLAREVSRDRVLTDEEIATLYRVASTFDPLWCAMIRLLILTGQRRGEVAGMRWDELDLANGLWSLPRERTKNGQPHTVPLSEPALVVLRSVKRRAAAEFVFEGPRGTAMSGFGKMKERLEGALPEALGRLVPEWTLHDLRRTTATGLQRLGVRLEVTEAVLNHVSGSRAGIVGVYQRHGWEREKVDALNGWAAHVVAHVVALAKDGPHDDLDPANGITGESGQNDPPVRGTRKRYEPR